MSLLSWADIASVFLLIYYGLLTGVILFYTYDWCRHSVVPRLKGASERLKYPTRYDKVLDAFKTKMLGHSPYRLWFEGSSMERCIFTNIHISSPSALAAPRAIDGNISNNVFIDHDYVPGPITIHSDEERSPRYWVSDGLKLLFESDSSVEVFQYAMDLSEK